MDFVYTSTYYVSDEDFEEIVDKVKSGCDVQKAIDSWASKLDEVDYYEAGFIMDDLYQTILEKVEG